MPDDLIISKLRDVVINHRARAWCRLPYPGHPKGCPNFGKTEECPPKAPLFKAIIKPPFILVAVRFNLEEHVRKMEEKHPNWSEKQAKCLLYWQKKVNKRLKKICEAIASKIPNAIVLYRPEGNGVHVFETCKKIGLILKKNPKKFVWKVAIVGIKK